MPCYRCGEPGHFVEECTTELCDIYLKPKHTFGECPLLLGPKPVVTIYGVCCQELMFFESPDVDQTTHLLYNSFSGIVRLTN
uniref:CCHC-type domain-containing protein n=1 Tax=Aegilops tauschii subsp. strangulata TaxID=200361 RepID=A0A453T918_AEGTS